jgi:internalin A
LAYLRGQQVDGERQWLSKLLVVGEGGVGKTSLLRALRGESFEVQQSSTHGIEIKALSLAHPTEAEVTMTLNTWDFGGQEIYHATHQFFLTNRSLFSDL